MSIGDLGSDVNRRKQCSNWMETIRGLKTADDPVAALKDFRARLDEVDDDCSGRPLENAELVPCQLAFSLHEFVNTILQRIRIVGPDPAALGRLVDYWENLYKLLLANSEPKSL